MKPTARIIACGALLLLTGCRNGLLPERPAILSPAGAREATAEEIRTVQETMRDAAVFLNVEPNLGPAPALLLFNPQSDAGRLRLRLLHQTREGAAGQCSRDGLQITVIADTATSYGLATLRHEAAHAALARVWDDLGTPIPFWLDEGLATLFESGVSVTGKPQPNPARQAMLVYLVQTRGRINLHAILDRHHPDLPDGMEYAKAWGVLWLLLERGERAGNLLRRAHRSPSFSREEISSLEQELRQRFLSH